MVFSGGVEGVGEMVLMLGDGFGLRFQIAILVECQMVVVGRERLS
jgi:hypothetical protein